MLRKCSAVGMIVSYLPFAFTLKLQTQMGYTMFHNILGHKKRHSSIEFDYIYRKRKCSVSLSTMSER